MNQFDLPNPNIAWCPGCGNFSILAGLKMALSELEIQPQNLVIVSGIGQAGKTPHYFKTNFFNGLHGRALPPATAIKAVNPNLTVIAESGDGDTYGEGGNHFIHAIRRNPDIVNIVHNNMVYALTKGQASPTSQLGFQDTLQTDVVFQKPFNPLAVAIAQDASFVARVLADDINQTKEIFKQALQHRGYALVDVLQRCPVFNRVNDGAWFKEHTYYLGADYQPHDRQLALAKALEENKLPLGIFYINTKRAIFAQQGKVYAKSSQALFERRHDEGVIKGLIKKMI